MQILAMSGLLALFAATRIGSDTKSCNLKASAPTSVTHDNQVVELLYIRSLDEPAIVVNDFKNVIIQNVVVEHGTTSAGIDFSGADGLLIRNVTTALVGGPTTGPLPSAGAVGINGLGTQNLRVQNVRTSGSSSGIYLLDCPEAHLSYIVGRNMRGPFPRGQCVQFNKSPNSMLEDFYCFNEVGKNVSHTEDNISVFQSNNVTIRRGLIDGNNSPSGDGIMVETGGSTEPDQMITTGT